MTTVCSICKKVVRQDDEPPIVGASGIELVSHGAHLDCMVAFYGEDFMAILEAQPT